MAAAAVTVTMRLDEDATAQNASQSASPSLPSGIATTAHPPLPADPAHYWLLPDASALRTATGADAEAGAALARGIAFVEQDRFDAALPHLQDRRLVATPLEPYARYYTGVALLALGRPDQADAALARIPASVRGYLQEAVPLRQAEAAMARGNAAAAADILDDLTEGGLFNPEEALLRLGAALEADGKTARALDAYRRVYYEFPLSTQAVDAQEAIERLQVPSLIPPNRFEMELARAERLFESRRWAQARAAYASLAPVARRDDGDLVGLRLAECDYHLGRHRQARDALRAHTRGGSREAEARYFHLSATRAVGEGDAYRAQVRSLVADHPTSPWTEQALNDLASRLVTNNEDAAADEVFRELARMFPRGRYTPRAAWKVGWRAYKRDRFAEAARTFEGAAAAFPRDDYRPSWLYWAARSRDRLGQRSEGTGIYRIVASDYLNSYYGRLASAVLADRGAKAVGPIVGPARSAGPSVPNDAVIRALVSVELYGAALNEVEYARRIWGDSPALQASVAGIRLRRGLQEGAPERFADVRGAITLMRRAYPQFMAAGGEHLPPDVLRVIFPLDYWPLIRKYADAHGLDPYLMTALVAQESTFTPDVRSSANAVGLMQLIPPTGRRVAARLGLRFTPAMLTHPETNVRLGMRYFKDLIDRFGGPHYALAGYNAGENRVTRWIAERPGFARDEFIDDIPFPETQAYVKRILGTAEDYRRLYGGGTLSASSRSR